MYPENQAISRAQNLLINDLWNTGPHRSRHQREADTQYQNGAESQSFAWINWQYKCEDTMANNHDNRTYHHHRRTFTLVVNKHAKEWGQYHCQDWEPLEQTRSLSVANHQGLLEEVGREALEWEDSRIVQYTQERDNPEHLAGEDLAKVRHMELVLWVVHISRLANSHELLIELGIHDGEDKEIEQANHEQQRSEKQ